MGTLLACLATLLPAVVGGLLWWRWGSDRVPTAVETAGYGAAIGVVLVALEMILVSRASAHYSLTVLLVPLALLGAGILSGPRRARREPTMVPPAERLRPIGGLALAVIGASGALVLGEISRNPILADWDGWAIWGIKAKAFFLDRGLQDYLLHADGHGFSWPARPCLTSLYQAFVYLALGRVDEGAARLFHVALSAIVVLLLYANLRRRFGRNAALVGAAVLTTLPDFTYQSSAGVGNVALGLYLFAALAALEGWESRSGLSSLAVAGLLLGGAFLARDEGIVLGGLVILATFSIPAPRKAQGFHTRARAGCVVLLVASLGYGLWGGLARGPAVWDIRTTWLDASLPARLVSHVRDVPAIIGAMAGELALSPRQARSSPLENRLGVALFWPLFTLVCAVGYRSWRADTMAVRCAWVICAALLAYAVGFAAFSYREVDEVIRGWIFVLDRHAIALVPMAIRVMASALLPLEGTPRSAAEIS